VSISEFIFILLIFRLFFAFEFFLFQSQQDLSLDDLGDMKDDQKKSCFTKRLNSPDRSVWDTSTFFSGGGKNEIEQMFEKFKIRMAAYEENADDSASLKSNVKTIVTDGVTDSDFSPGHSEYSKLIGGVNKAYASSVDDNKGAGSVRNTKQDGEKKKHKHKKDKRDNEKKSRHAKSKSKHATEADSTVVTPVGTQMAKEIAPQQLDSSVFIATGGCASGNDVHHSTAEVHLVESGESGLPEVHTSCHTNIVLLGSTVVAQNTDEVASVDLNPLDVSTLELLPPTPAREV